MMSTRTSNGLGLGGIRTIGDLLSADDRHLLGLKGFGPSCLAEVKSRLLRRDMRLGDRPGKYGGPDLRRMVAALLRRIEWYGGHGLCGACYRGPRKGHMRGCLLAEIRALVDAGGTQRLD